MRYVIAPAVVLSMILAGCDQRENIAVVPDRQGHAYGAEGVQQPISNTPTARTGEMYYTLQPNEQLFQVAKKFNVDLGWLIKRNRIEDETKVKPGMTLIVPRVAMAPAMPQSQGPAPAPAPSTPSASSTKPAPRH
jgi:hypothetical protein